MSSPGREAWRRAPRYDPPPSRPLSSCGLNGPGSAMSARAASTWSQTFQSSTPRTRPSREVVDDALAEGLLPVGDRLAGGSRARRPPRSPGRRGRSRRRGGGGRASRSPAIARPADPAHRVGVVLVLDADALAERRAEEAGDVAGGVDVRVRWCAGARRRRCRSRPSRPGRLGELDVGRDPEPGHDAVDLERASAARVSTEPAPDAAPGAPVTVCPGAPRRPSRGSSRRGSAPGRRGRRARRCPASGKTIVTRLPFIASAAAISEPMNPPPITAKRRPCVGQGAQAPVVVERAEVDDAVAAEGQAPRRAAGGEEQLLEGVGRRPGRRSRGSFREVEGRRPPPEVERRRPASPAFRQMLSTGSPFQSPFESGGRL